MNIKISKELFKKAQKYIPGGVNSPVRAYKSVGLTPPFIKSAVGSRIYDQDGNEYIDYVGSWGPMLLGHNHPRIRAAIEKALLDGTSFGAPTKKEVEIAELICEIVPSIEMLRLVNSGTEATMSAIRLARAFTGKSKVIKFNGCYHGHSDGLLAKAGSGAILYSAPNSPGVLEDFSKHTLICEYNSKEDLENVFGNHDDIACVIIEPVAGNMGVVPPEKDFLKFLRDITKKHNCLLIFDEVMTGFRLALGGAQELYGITPDLTTFGKIIGGGLPVGAYGGNREIMKLVSPGGNVYQAGTLSGNPLAVSAGLETLTILHENDNIYKEIEIKSKYMEEKLNYHISLNNLPMTVNRVGSMLCLFFTPVKVKNFKDAQTSNTDLFAKYFKEMLEKNIYLPPSQFESLFISYAHTQSDIDVTLEKITIALNNAYMV